MAGWDDQQSGYDQGYDDGYADAEAAYNPYSGGGMTPGMRKRQEEKRTAIKEQNKRFNRNCFFVAVVAFFACYGFTLLMEKLAEMGSP